MFRSNREKNIFIVLAIIGVVLILNISNALAETIYSNDGSGASCECIINVDVGTGDWDHGSCDQYDPWQYWPLGGGNWTCDNDQADTDACQNPHYCGGEPPYVELAEMGSFNSEGVWVWDSGFAAEFGAWAGSEWSNWQELFTPYKSVKITDSRMDFKHFADAPNHVRVAVQLSSGIMIPRIFKSDGSFFVDLEAPPGCVGDEEGNMSGAEECVQECYDDFNCDPMTIWHDGNQSGSIECQDEIYCEFSPDTTNTHPNPCCWFWNTPLFRLVDEGPFDKERFVDMKWVNKDKVSVPLTLVDKSCLYPVNYNNDRGSQEWEFFQDEFCYVDNYFVFPDNLNPDIGDNTFILTYDGNKTIELNYYVFNNSDMPVVPATISHTVGVDKYTKSGKHIQNEHVVTSQNITARVLNGALVIQWAEPDAALFPDPDANRKELQCWVGAAHDDTTGMTFEGSGLWIRSPYQIGSIVVPQSAFEFIKNKVQSEGGNRLEIEFQYRLKYDGGYQNRGYSESIFLDF